MFYTCEIRLLVLLSQQELCFLYNSFFLFSKVDTFLRNKKNFKTSVSHSY
jgi:hypothetical protein